MRMFFTGTAPGGSGDKMVDFGSGFGLPQEEESRIKDAVGDVNNALGSTVQVHGGLQKPQQKLQGLVAWERFLPVRSLKVLLVENDDSTRHVVSALLRNCSYEVTSVANGLQAWNILEDLTNHFDIILTEVVMPFVTGIGLLCKIMNHKTLKNIPVIMMSSHDSMGIVFKCLSKGAVDFLVKPIRKNELKNLWQHVWRRCHSSSGSGSESGTQTKRSAVSKSNESANNNGSNDERDNGSPGLSVQDGSDNGSGTQSSRTKRVVEIDSPQPISQWDQLADDSTCAQTMHIKPERISDSWLHIATTKKHPEENEKQDHVAMGKDLEIGMSRNAYLSLESQGEKFSIDSRSTEQSKLPDPESTAVGEEQVKHHTEDASDKMSTRTAYLMTSDVNCTTLLHSKSAEPPIGFTENSQHKDKVSCDSRNLPSRRLRGVAEGIVTQNERNVLRHSDLSAFSKYNNASSSNQGPTGNVGSCSPLGNSSDAIKTDTMENFASKSNITPVLHSNGSSNINNVANTKHATPKPECLNDKSEPVSAFRYFPDSTDEPVQDDSICHHQVIPGKADDLEVNTVHTEKRGSHLHVQVQHHHHHYHHYHHHVHNLQQKQQQQQHQQTDPEDCSLKKMCADAPQCGSSNVFGGLVEAVNVKLRADTPQRTVNVFAEENAGNYSVNGSASGSNYGSNGQNGSSIALNAGVANMESDNGMTRNPGSHDTDGKAGGNGGEEDRCAQREAALTKFRQKRKGRCFEKKVRYQSRKRLAEQRPRVRGQFVRQTICDDKADKDVQSCCLESGDDSCDR